MLILRFLAGAGVFDFFRVLTTISRGGVQIILRQSGVALQDFLVRAAWPAMPQRVSKISCQLAALTARRCMRLRRSKSVMLLS